jgi:hypothetical protein
LAGYVANPEAIHMSDLPLAPSALPHNTRCCFQSGQHSHKSSSRYTVFVSNSGTARLK